MVGSLLAGTEESPGEVFLYQGRSYKGYRGMGSVGAMARGSADRYFQAEVRDALKLVPEGVEGQVAYKGPVEQRWCTRSSAACAPPWAIPAARTIADFHRKAQFVRITGAGLRESHVHDVTVTREAPNYHPWRAVAACACLLENSRSRFFCPLPRCRFTPGQSPFPNGPQVENVVEVQRAPRSRAVAHHPRRTSEVSGCWAWSARMPKDLDWNKQYLSELLDGAGAILLPPKADM